MNVLRIIGAFQVGRWLYHLYKHRRIFMDKEKFWEFVRNLRYGITYPNRVDAGAKQRHLDNIIKTVTGGDNMAEEKSLQEDVASIIKRIKEAKENEELKEKADTLIEKLKAEL